MSAPRFQQQLAMTARRLRLRRMLAWLAMTGMGIGGALLLADVWGSWFGLQEENAFLILVLLLCGGVLALAVGAWRILAQTDNLRQLARTMERNHPELQDLLITAVERVENEMESSHPLERGLMAEASRRTDGFHFAKELTPRFLGNSSLLAMALIAALLLLTGTATDTLRKAAHVWADTRAGIFTGMRIEPAHLGITRGADLTLQAEILRWEPEAVVEFSTNQTRERHPMVQRGEREEIRVFRFYEVEEPIQFRILTPSLRSAWHTITPFDPPQLDSLRITATPPAYTRMEPMELEGIGDLRVISGSEIEFHAHTRETTAITLQVGGTSIPFPPPPPLDSEAGEPSQDGLPPDGRLFQHTHTAERSARYALHLTNPNASLETREARLEVYPDEPPVVEILRPARDVRLDPEERLELEVYVADDFGITEVTVRLSIAGRTREQFSITPRIPEDGNLREETIASLIDLATLDVQEGELVTYYVEVTDNREPTPQTTRSEVFFVEVRVEEEPEEVEGAPDEEERIELRAYIEELKRLIRASHRVELASGEDRLARSQEVASGLSRLRGELNSEYENIRPLLQQAGDRFFTRAFEAALALLDTAERLITRDFVDSSILSQEQALQELILIENELRSNMVSREPQESGEGEQGETAEGEEGESEPGDEPRSLQEEIAALRDLLQNVQALADQQNAQNLAAERASRTGASRAETNALAGQQESLRETARQLEQEMERAIGTEPARASTRLAGRHMGEARHQLGDHNPERAWREGIRAGDALDHAARHLQDQLDEAVKTASEFLEQHARELASRQRESAEQTQSAATAGDGDGEAMHADQVELNESAEQFLDAIDQFASEIGREFPESARALRQTTREARQGSPSREMSRAANALLYEQLTQAAPLQEEAATGLERLGDSLREAGDQFPALTEAQLERLLQELQQDQSTLSELSGDPSEEATSQHGEIRASWGDRLQRLGERIGDDALAQYGNQLHGEEGAHPRDTAHTLGEAAEQLLHHRERHRRREILNLRRQTAPPPEQYRRQVEEYFRRLSEGTE